MADDRSVHEAEPRVAANAGVHFRKKMISPSLLLEHDLETALGIAYNFREGFPLELGLSVPSATPR